MRSRDEVEENRKHVCTSALRTSNIPDPTAEAASPFCMTGGLAASVGEPATYELRSVSRCSKSGVSALAASNRSLTVAVETGERSSESSFAVCRLAVVLVFPSGGKVFLPHQFFVHLFLLIVSL